jgi:uncharacterized protein
MDDHSAALPDDQPQAPATVAEPGWGWREVGLVILATLGTTALLGLGARGLSTALGLEIAGGLVSPALYLTGLGIYLSVIAAIYVFVVRRAGWAALGLGAASWRDYLIVPPLFVLELAALVGVNLLVAQIAGGFENPQVEAISGGQALSAGELLMLLVLIAGVVPFVEELFFRGMLYPLLRRRMGALAAILLNAALFALFHVFPLLLPGLFVVGIFLAYLRERSGSIWPSVMLHAMQNGLALLAISAALG